MFVGFASRFGEDGEEYLLRSRIPVTDNFFDLRALDTHGDNVFAVAQYVGSFVL